MKFTSRFLATACIGATALCAARALDAQDSTATVPLKQVAPVEARTARPVGNIQSLRALPDGSVLVNDNQRRQLLRFDASLADARIVADTAAGAPLPYSQRGFGMLPYLGDSTMLADPTTSALVILNGEGKVARIAASPRNNDLNLLAQANLGSNAIDSKGQLVYREGQGGGGPGLAQMFGSGNERGGRGGGQPGQPGRQGGGGQQGRGGAQQGRGGDGGFGGPPAGFMGGGTGPGGFGGRGGGVQPDSVPIVRANFDTRKTDSVAWLKVPRNETSMTRGDDGSMRITAKINPLPQGDDWALLSDGTVAVVRVLDYHVDFYTADGTHEASERLPFDWKRISDDEKIKMVDSLQALAKVAADRAAAQGGNNNFRMNFEVIAPEKLPDYYPPIRPGSTLADRDGNLWILPSTSNLSAQMAQQMMMGGGGRGGPGGPGGAQAAAQAGAARGAAGGRGASPDSAARGGRGAPPAGFAGMMPGMASMPPLIYDVVNRKGALVHRVQLPAGRQIAGFGPNGTIYLIAREGREVFIERTRVVN